VADSAGINVWCAAGVCDFNEHKIADAVNATALAGVVGHRVLVLPQLAAVGIDLSRLKQESGFQGTWGPASLDDLPEYLRAGRATPVMRQVEFPAADRIHNAIGMFNVFLILPLVCLLIWGAREALFVLTMNFVNIFGTFLLYPRLPFRYPANNSIAVGLVALGLALADGLVRGPATTWDLGFRLASGGFVSLMVAIDMLGSTPFYKTTMAHWFATGDNRSLFQPEVLECCTGCGCCETVCPKGIFSLARSGAERPRAVADLDRECCECLACVKQCPALAITNVHGTLFKDDIKSVPQLAQVLRIGARESAVRSDPRNREAVR
jgi:ferredoxin